MVRDRVTEHVGKVILDETLARYRLAKKFPSWVEFSLVEPMCARCHDRSPSPV